MKESERLERLYLARRLRAAGVPLAIEEDDAIRPAVPKAGVFLDQVYTSFAIELNPFQVGYSLRLRIVSNLPSLTAFRELVSNFLGLTNSCDF